MKKLVSVLAVLILLVGLGVLAEGAAKKTVVVWERLDADLHEMFVPYLHVFEAANPDIKIDDYNQPDLEQKAIIALSGGNPPDVIIEDFHLYAKFLGEGVLLDVTPYMDKQYMESIFPSHLAIMSKDGRYFGFPYSLYTIGLFVRNSWIKDAGLGAPKDYADLARIADKCTDPAKQRFGWATAGVTSRAFADWYYEHYLFAADGQIFDAASKKALVNSKESKAVLNMYKDMIHNKKVAPAGIATWEGGDWNKAWYAGQVAVFLAGIWEINPSEKALNGDYIITSVPCPAGTRNPKTYSETKPAIILKSTKNPAEAAKFCKWLSSPNTQIELIKKGIIGESPTKGVDLAKLSANPKNGFFSEQIKERPIRIAPPHAKQWEIRLKISELVQQIIVDKNASVDALCDKYAKAIQDEFLSKY